MSKTNNTHDEVCNRSHTIGPTKLYRLKSDLEKEKREREEADAYVAFNVLVGVLFITLLFMIFCLIIRLSNG